jgi:hypothetical protein
MMETELPLNVIAPDDVLSSLMAERVGLEAMVENRRLRAQLVAENAAMRAQLAKAGVQ